MNKQHVPLTLSEPKHKNNTNPTMDLLTKALRQLPQDFSLREVRHHISQALRKIEQVEKKRSNRVAQQSQTPTTPQFAFYSPDAIGIIDQMIESEKEKIDTIKKSKEKNKSYDRTSKTLLG